MNKIFKFEVFLLLSLIFVGCTSKKSLRISKTNEKICSNKSVEITYSMLLEGLKLHYTGSKDLSSHTEEGLFATPTILISMPGTTYIEDAHVNNKYEIYVSIKNGISPKLLGELIEISQNDKKCRTLVKINYMNKMWKRHGVFVKELLQKINKE